MKYLLIAVDNLNRDYYPDKIIALSDDEQLLKDKSNIRNSLEQEFFYKVVDRDYKLCFDSMFDASGHMHNSIVIQELISCHMMKQWTFI